MKAYFCYRHSYSLKSGPETRDPGLRTLRPGIQDPGTQDPVSGTLRPGNQDRSGSNAKIKFRDILSYLTKDNLKLVNQK